MEKDEERRRGDDGHGAGPQPLSPIPCPAATVWSLYKEKTTVSPKGTTGIHHLSELLVA